MVSDNFIESLSGVSNIIKDSISILTGEFSCCTIWKHWNYYFGCWLKQKLN